MAKNKQQKKELLNKYKAMIEDYRGLVIVKTKEVTPNEVNNLRKQLFDFESEFKTIKNSIFKIALSESDMSGEGISDGAYSVMTFKDDLVNPAKTLKQFITDTHVKTEAAKYDKVEIVYGFLDGNELTQSQVVELAEMPEKEQSIAMILGILDQAISGIANVLQNPVQSYLSVIDQAFKE